MEQEITQLENRLSDLLLWRDSIQDERLRFPLDLQSRKTLDYYPVKNVGGLFLSTGRIFPDFSGVATTSLLLRIQITVNGQKRNLLATFVLQQFTADAATDFITNVNGAHNLNNDDPISLTTDNTLPAPLTTNVAYYVVNRTGTTFQVSGTIGGPAINITSSGTGTHYYGKI